MPRHPAALALKYRQAGMVYLHVGLLYLFAVWAMGGAGLIAAERGPVWLWLIIGVGILTGVFWGLWSWQQPLFVKVIWGLHALRLPVLIEGAFFPAAGSQIPSSFYLTALVVVLGNLAMLARAAWDL